MPRATALRTVCNLAAAALAALATLAPAATTIFEARCRLHDNTRFNAAPAASSEDGMRFQ